MGHHLSRAVAPERRRLFRIDLLEAMLSSELVEHSQEERKGVRQCAVEVEDGQSISHLSSRRFSCRSLYIVRKMTSWLPLLWHASTARPFPFCVSPWPLRLPQRV